jgi:hypothetical protein
VTDLKIRKMFYFVIKYIVIYTLVRYELAFTFWLFKPLFMMDKTGWSGLLLVIVVTGFDLAIYFLFRCQLIEWDRKIAKKMLRIDEI